MTDELTDDQQQLLRRIDDLCEKMMESFAEIRDDLAVIRADFAVMRTTSESISTKIDVVRRKVIRCNKVKDRS